MALIKLSEQCTIDKPVDSIIGYLTETVFEPVYINPDFIESMSWSGLTYIRMQSGNKIVVKEEMDCVLKLIQELSK